MNEFLRERLGELHDKMWGSTAKERGDKSDLNLIVDILEVIIDQLDEIDNHSHAIL